MNAIDAHTLLQIEHDGYEDGYEGYPKANPYKQIDEMKVYDRGWWRGHAQRVFMDKAA